MGQELAGGMVAFHDAHQISTVPFPFPYAQTCDALLFMHWVITPFVSCQWSANSPCAAVFSFVQVFILWSLNNIAVEIEHPFGDDDNDLDAAHHQAHMNHNLLLLLHPFANKCPELSPEAVTGQELAKMGRRASKQFSTSRTFMGMHNMISAEESAASGK